MSLDTLVITIGLVIFLMGIVFGVIPSMLAYARHHPAIASAEASVTPRAVVDPFEEGDVCVRVKVAAVLLGLSVPTVHKWIELGLLKEAPGESSVRRVNLTSILRVRPLVAEVQKLGRKRNLLEAVLARMEDDAITSGTSLRRSIKQWESGDRVDITPPKD
jgi:hypothetical protein